jgi:hypothetical protein
MKLLPKVTGGLLTFLGEGMQRGESWEQCRTRVLKEYFPLFVREKLIRELVVFNFHERGCPLRQFIKEVIEAAEFLQYEATEAEIIEQVLMNLYPDVLAPAALLPRPSSYKELRDMVGLLEERMAVSVERQRPNVGVISIGLGGEVTTLNGKEE